ncbi:magnesium/cobalt transporter CorA [Tichowtungia aerotolerans]|uniref:Magnesium transport protein CorA n=1 Tax=Tichowtungia aerotolerans TaxID=2697043 RepID=A0A6P1M693_9BACT|nr:magnesium/cobalt transporter CorA [Tichowtungia aerotolerans]QHI68124.1 magnesium/cobalt transporter CorA [Tichowtungia aerotolerans]
MSKKNRLPHPKRKPGLAPGSLVIDPSWPKPAIRVIAYGPDKVEEKPIGNLTELNEYLGKWPVTWINVNGLGDESILRQLGSMFDLHLLALEDVVNLRQRSKVDDYETTLYTAMRMLSLNEERLSGEQVSFFLGKNFVLTFQEVEGDCLDPVRDRIRNHAGRIRGAGPDYLLYALIDAIVDAYFPVLEAYDLRLEELEDDVLGKPDNSTRNRLFNIKHDLTRLRRTLWPVREMTGALAHSESRLITESTLPYLRDCQDHAVQLLELAESYRETGSSLMDFYLSSISNRMNEIMKVLTIIATIFIPLTFIAGIYGMNFENMPELHVHNGYFIALGVMTVLGLAMFAWFVHKGWLSSPRRRKDP